MNRRRFLVAGVATAGLATAGAAAFELRPFLGPTRAARQPLRVLDERTFGIVAAIVDRVCPAAEGLPSGWDLRVPERVDEFLDRVAPAYAAEVVTALRLFESPTLSMLTGGPPTPFSRMSADQQDHKLAAWRDGRSIQRTVWRAVTTLAKSAYWSDPATFAHVGYVRPAWATP